MIHRSIQKRTLCRLRRFWIAMRPVGREMPVSGPRAPPKFLSRECPPHCSSPRRCGRHVPSGRKRPRCRGRFRRRGDKRGRPPHEKHRMRRGTDPAHRVPTVAPEPPVRQQRAPITHKPVGSSSSRMVSACGRRPVPCGGVRNPVQPSGPPCRQEPCRARVRSDPGRRVGGDAAARGGMVRYRTQQPQCLVRPPGAIRP